MASMCVEIQTSRAIAQQILRHRSFHFQEFSMRYSKAVEFDFYEARTQDTKNRQNSFEASDELEKWFLQTQQDVYSMAYDKYNEALNLGIAKESARFLLPLAIQTKMYMHGTLRDWIHYLNLRTEKSTQKEHREIAEFIKQIFIIQFPIISLALNWIDKLPEKV